MPRLPEVTNRDSLPEESRASFDYLVQTRGRAAAPFSFLLNSPDLGQRVAHVGSYCRFDSVLPGNVTELATLTAAREFDCRFQWADHEPLARQKGVSEAAIEVIAHKRPLDGLGDEEALPIRCGREILRDHRLSDASYEAAKQRYGGQGVIDLIGVVGYYGMLACLINALEIFPPPEAAQLP